MKKIRELLIILSLLISSNACSAQDEQAQRHINFDDDWKFHFGNASDPLKDFNYSIVNIFSKTGKAEGTAIDLKFMDTGWHMVNLPHDWAAELPFVNSPNF